MSARPSFEELVRGRRGGPAFVPLLEELAPRLEGRSRRELTADPTLWASAAERLAALAGADAVAIGWDASLLAEACGVPLRWEDDRPLLGEPPPEPNPAAAAAGRVPAFLEAVRRLAAADRACVAALPGPASLAACVLGPVRERRSLAALKSILVAVAEALCRARPDALALVEAGADGAAAAEIRRIYATLRNLADYYGVATILHVAEHGDVAAAAAAAASLGIDHLMVGGSHAGPAPDPAAAVAAAAGLGSFALPLGLRDAQSTRQSAAAALSATAGRPAVYFTTPGPLPRDSDMGVLREVGAALRTIAH